MITRDHEKLSVRRQGQILGLHRSTAYYEPRPEPAGDLPLMRLLDQEYTRHPFYGSRQLTRWLEEQGHDVIAETVRKVVPLRPPPGHLYSEPTLRRFQA